MKKYRVWFFQYGCDVGVQYFDCKAKDENNAIQKLKAFNRRTRISSIELLDENS